MKREKGFTFPLSACFLLLFSSFFLIHVEIYLNEKKFYNETEEILRQEFYMLCAVQDIEKMLLLETTIPTSGVLHYESGSVYYVQSKLSDTVDQFIFTMPVNATEQITGTGIYDKTLKKMVKWTEKN